MSTRDSGASATAPSANSRTSWISLRRNRRSRVSSQTAARESTRALAAMLLRRDVDEERNEHIDMTPMVDVVFQLMTFMLFSIQMTGGEKVDVPPARHGIGVEETAATFLSMTKPSGPG